MSLDFGRAKIQYEMSLHLVVSKEKIFGKFAFILTITAIGFPIATKLKKEKKKIKYFSFSSH